MVVAFNIRIKNYAEEPIFVNNYGKKLSRDSIVTNFRRIGQDAGLKKEKGRYAFWNPLTQKIFHKYHHKQSRRKNHSRLPCRSQNQ